MLDPLYGEDEREVGDSMPVFCTEREARRTILGGTMERKAGTG